MASSTPSTLAAPPHAAAENAAAEEVARPRKKKKKQAAHSRKAAAAAAAAAATKSLATSDVTAGGRGSVVAEGPGFKLVRLMGSFVLHSKQPPPPQQQQPQQQQREQQEQREQGSGEARVCMHGAAVAVVSRGPSSLVVCLPSPVDASRVTATMSRGAVQVSMPFLAGAAAEM